MGDYDEIKTGRLVGTIDDGLDLAQRWPQFEASVRHVFGLPADTVMSEAMQITTAGNITMTGDLYAAQDPVSDLEAATQQYVLAQTSNLGGYRCRAFLTSDATLGSETTNYIQWQYADINVGSIWSPGNADRLVIPYDGDYFVGWTFSGYMSDSSTSETIVMLDSNRFGLGEYRCHQFISSSTSDAGCSGMHYIDGMINGDFIRMAVVTLGAGGATYTVNSANTTFWLFNLEL